jgi:hypothetical protein
LCYGLCAHTLGMRIALNMHLDHLSNADIPKSVQPRLSDSAAESWRPWGGRYFRLASAFLLLNVISALLFIQFVPRPVFDDPNYLPDVHRYATQGVSVDTIRRHVSPPGPVGFIWMAVAVDVLRGNELRDARLACVISWLVIGGVILLGGRYSHFPELWCAALLFTLVLPHTLTATATLRAEGPAMAFALFGTLAWLESASRPSVTPGLVFLGAIGGLSIGLAIDSRQYYLALLAAVAAYAIYQWRERGFEMKSLWFANAIGSLAAASIPLLLLIFVWHGLASPGMVSGASYTKWVAKVGFNALRPIVAAFYIALYAFPAAFPAILEARFTQRWRAGLVAAVGGATTAYFFSTLVQPGPIKTFVEFLGRTRAGEHIVLGIITAVAIYNSICLGCLIREKWEMVRSCPPIVLALLVLAFFVVEQIGIGGNLPFYEIYILEVAPFLGVVAFGLLPKLTGPRVSALIFLSVISQGLLWRYAFRA